MRGLRKRLNIMYTTSVNLSISHSVYYWKTSQFVNQTHYYEQSSYYPISKLVNQLIIQSVNQSISKLVIQLISQSINHSIIQSFNQSISKLVNQLISQSINQSIRQSVIMKSYFIWPISQSVFQPISHQPISQLGNQSISPSAISQSVNKPIS